ncbi:MAG: PAS domain-containing protein, partial [bacterium]
WIGTQLFEKVPANIAVINRDFEILLANGNFTGMFGDVTGKHCYEAFKKKEATCDHCMAAQTFEDGQVRVSNEYGIDREGRPAYYVVHNVPIYNEDGEITSVIEMSYDVTDTQSLQRQYNILFERVPCYVAVLDEDLKVVRANEMLRNTFGEMRGQHCYRLYKHRHERCDNCPAVKTFADGRSYTQEQVGINKRGAVTHYIVSTAPLSKPGDEVKHVIEMSIDVTEIQKLTQDLLEESHFRHQLTENALDALIGTDAAGVVNIFNPAAERLFKMSAAEVIGRERAWDFLPDDFRRIFDQEGKTLVLPETTVQNSDGVAIPVRFSGTVLGNGLEIIGGAAFLQDLRPYKKLEMEKLMNERLAVVGQTVAQLSHGMKNILTGVQGGLYGIRVGVKKNDMDRLNVGRERLERNVARINELVRGFLSYTKEHVPQKEPADLNRIADEVFTLFQDAAANEGIRLNIERAEGMEPIEVDPKDIHVCLVNLVSNAIDACVEKKADAERGARQEDKVVASEERHTGEAARSDEFMSAGDLNVTIRVLSGPMGAVLEVTDTGCGMDETTVNKVFNTFFTTKGLEGNGLGLLVTRKLVNAHGGTIAVDSVEGEGSTFRIELPSALPPVDSNA